MTETARPRGPYAKTAAKRAAVARAALDIVLEKGHRNLTTAEVAERAGMSERSMLYHFPTRDHLLVAAMELQDAQNAQSSTVAQVGTMADPLQEVPRLIARQNTNNPEPLRLFNHLASAAQDPEHPAHEFMVRHNERGIRALAAMVRARQAQGLAHPDIDADAAARQMLAAWSGLQSQWLVDPGFDLADELTQAFRRLSGQPAMEARAMLDDLMARI